MINKEKARKIFGKIKVQKNSTRIALLGILAGGSLLLGVKQCNTKDTQNKEKIEMSYEHNSYWQGEERDAKILNLPRETLAPGVQVIRDQGMTFYIVQKGDCLSTIRQKLGKIKEFSYLKDSKYALQDGSRNINSFNVPSKLEAGMFIPIPLAREQRETSDKEFYQMSLEAIAEMETHPSYGTIIKALLKEISKEEIAATMCAYARSETAQDWKSFSDNIGSVTLHRREPHMKAFSFSHYHILMEKNKDGSAGPGLKARQKLGLTEGQTYHPKNGGKLFLAYWIEKNKSLKKENKINFSKMLNMKNEDDAKKYGEIYNGFSEYGKKLRANYQHYQKKFHTKKH